MIHKATIDAVFESSRLEEVIGDFVQLKKSGANFKGLSPFSDERTPSFMVSPVKQIWKDFSSGKGGNVVAFLMEHEHFTYPEAIKYLANKYNIEVEETEQTDEQKQQADEKESMFLVNEFAAQFFQNTLHKTDSGKIIGLSYFKERGFTIDTINKFKLGYSPDVWDAFTSAAIQKGYKLDYLDKTGLTIVKEEKQFDRFKGRVMFPILSMSGRVLGFGGRILDNEKKAAKYLNSPESEVYHKSKVLFGLYHAKQAIAKEDNCYLVEGYTDVIQFNQTGITNVVSSSGTALTPDQIRLVNRLTKNITVLFDSDAAGIRASLRGIDLILEQGMNVKVCSFPDGEDPDSFAKNNTEEELRQYLEDNVQDFIRFKASMLNDESKNDPIKKAELVRDMVTSISKIPDVIKQEIYIKECSRIMQVSEEVLFDTLAQLVGTAERKQQKSKESTGQEPLTVLKNETVDKAEIDRQYILESYIIKVLLAYGSNEEEFEDLILKEDTEGVLILEPEISKVKVFEKIYLDLQEDEIEFTNQAFKDIYKLVIDELNQGLDLKVENFINKIEPELASEITEILMTEERYELHRWSDQEIHVKQKKDSIASHVNSIILNLRGFLVDKKIHDLSQEVKEHGLENNMTILEDIRDYQILKKLLFQKLNRVI